MPSAPAVSVITPAYNAASTIKNCVESIRNQSYGDWEHIIIDDGSTDSTWMLLEALSAEDSRIRILRQANTGSSKARNVGIEAAKGEYIALLDADDRSMPERLRKQVGYLESNPDVDLLGSGYVNVTETGAELDVTLPPPGHDLIKKIIYKHNPFCTSTVIARRRFFKDTGGFDESIFRAEDYDLWLRGYAMFRYDNLLEPLVYYRRVARPSWRDSVWSARVRMKAIRRERTPLWYLWYPSRQLLATLLAKLSLKKPWY